MNNLNPLNNLINSLRNIINNQPSQIVEDATIAPATAATRKQTSNNITGQILRCLRRLRGGIPEFSKETHPIKKIFFIQKLRAL